MEIEYLHPRMMLKLVLGHGFYILLWLRGVFGFTFVLVPSRRYLFLTVSFGHETFKIL